MRFRLSSTFVSLFIFMLINVSLLSAQATPIISIVDSQTGMTFAFERTSFRGIISSYKPNLGTFLVVYGTLRNRTNSSLCPYASEVILNIDGQDYLPDDTAMDKLLYVNSPYRDYIGSRRGQCISGGKSALTYVVYDVPTIFTHARLTFQNIPLNITFDGLMTPTPSPSPTITQTPTVTFTPTSTATPTNTSIPTSTYTPTYTATASQTNTATITPSPTLTPVPASVLTDGTNARGCPATTCGVVSVVSSRDTLAIIGIDSGWYLVQLPSGEQAYIRSDLMRLPKDVEVANAPTRVATNTPTHTPTRTPTPRPINTLLIPTARPVTATQKPQVNNASDQKDANTISDTLFILAGGRNVEIVRVVDGRPNGGERTAMIAYLTTESTTVGAVDEILDIMDAVAVAIDTDDLDLDYVQLILGDAFGNAVGTAGTSVANLLAYHAGRISRGQFLNHLDVVSLGS